MFASVLDPVINMLDPADISARIRQLMLLDDLGLLALAFLVTCDLADDRHIKKGKAMKKKQLNPGQIW